MQLGLAGKSVVVTGGASNIGRSVVLAYAAEGCKIALFDYDAGQAEKVVAEAKAAGAAQVELCVVDVTSLESVTSAFATAKEKLGSVDVLVNVVGGDVMSPFMKTDEKFWEKIISLNYRSVLNTTKAVLPIMIEQKGGAIVSIGSEAGRLGERNEAVYAGTKAGVISFSKAIAREHGRDNIRVNVVCPGMTVPKDDTAVGDKSAWKVSQVTPEVMEAAKKMYPLRRLGTPDDIANAVVFLSSDAANYITGQTLSVSGGYSMI